MFTTRNGTPIRASNLLTIYKRPLNRAGLPEWRFHDLRHSTASFLLARGIPMKVFSELLGHSETRITSERHSFILPGVTKGRRRGSEPTPEDGIGTGALTAKSMVWLLTRLSKGQKKWI